MQNERASETRRTPLGLIARSLLATVVIASTTLAAVGYDAVRSAADAAVNPSLGPVAPVGETYCYALADNGDRAAFIRILGDVYDPGLTVQVDRFRLAAGRSNIEALAIRPDGGVFAIDDGSGAAASTLGRILPGVFEPNIDNDATTNPLARGDFDTVATLNDGAGSSLSLDVDGLTFIETADLDERNDVLIGAVRQGGPDEVVVIDPSTGTVTGGWPITAPSELVSTPDDDGVTNISADDVDDIAWDPVTDRIFAVLGGSSLNYLGRLVWVLDDGVGGTTTSLTVPRTPTGAPDLSAVVSLDFLRVGAPAADDVEGLGFSDSGANASTYFGVVGDGGTNDDELLAIDRDTGVATTLIDLRSDPGQGTGNQDYESIDCIQIGARGANEIAKRAVAQNPVGSVSQTLEGSPVDWTVQYETGFSTVQLDALIQDQPLTNMALVPGSVQAPQGWTSTVVDPTDLRLEAAAVAPGGKGVAISMGSDPSTGSAGFTPAFCRSGVPDDITWTRSAVSNFVAADWASFVVTVRLPDGTVVGTYDADAGVTSVDLSGLDPASVTSLDYQIDATIEAGRSPLSDPATTPVVSIEFDTAAPLEFCYQTISVADACAQPIASNLAAFQLGDEPALETVSKSLEILADPAGRCFDPSVTLDKTVYSGHDGGSGCPGAESVQALPGDEVTWCFVVTNTGDTDLDQVTITDPDLAGAPVSIPAVVPQGESRTVSIEGVAPPADLTNTAEVTGRAVYDDATPIPGADTPRDDDTAAIDIVEPALSVEKTVYPGSGDGGVGCSTAGELVSGVNGAPVTYCVTISNTGDTALIDVQVDDLDLGIDEGDMSVAAGSTGTLGRLDAGELVILAIESTIDGDLTNTATGSAQPAFDSGAALPGGRLTLDDTAAVDEIAPGLQLSKTVYRGHDNGATCDGVESVEGERGEQVTYCFTVSNAGDSELTSVEVTDSDLGITDTDMTLRSGSLATIPAGGSVELHFETTIDGDLEPNTATASATTLAGSELTDDDTAAVDELEPAVSIDKTVYPGHDSGASCAGSELGAGVNGEAVTYCFVVTNTGDDRRSTSRSTTPIWASTEADMTVLSGSLARSGAGRVGDVVLRDDHRR